MIRNDWEGAGRMLAKLWVSIPTKSCENNDLRLRWVKYDVPIDMLHRLA